MKQLSQDNPQTYDLKWNPSSYVKVECKLGNIYLKSQSPISSYYVIFSDEMLEAFRLARGGWFYAGLEGKKSPIIDAMEIYKIQELVDQEHQHLFEIMWSEDGLKAALLINHHFHAVFDFEGLKGYCQTAASHTGNFGFKQDHKWSEAALKHFVGNPDDIIVPPKPPSAKEKQKEFIKLYLKPTLKAWGYQTSGQIWWKDKGDFFVVIALANSSYNLAEHVSFWFNITLAIASKLKDPIKKKVSSRDVISLGIYETTYLPKDRHKHLFRDNRYIHLKEDTNLAEFIAEMKIDFEKEILPCLEKLQTLNDWVVFYESTRPHDGFLKQMILGS
jgi:hypothetical protein